MFVVCEDVPRSESEFVDRRSSDRFFGGGYVIYHPPSHFLPILLSYSPMTTQNAIKDDSNTFRRTITLRNALFSQDVCAPFSFLQKHVKRKLLRTF